MLEATRAPDNPFIFSPAHVIDYCDFIESLQHVEDGNWVFTQVAEDGRPDPRIILEPWQIWVEAAIHGFRRRTTGERLVSRVLELCPRKSAKSLRVAGAALYELCCSGQLSPQITIAASTRDQAGRVFDPICKFIGREPDLAEQFKLIVTKDEIRCGATGGEIFKLSSIGERQDGLNPLLAVFEEGHAGAESVYKVVRSAFGARPNALLRMITTAGYHPEGPAWELLQEAKLILEGRQEDPSFFAAIYGLDEEDYLDEKGGYRIEKLLTDQRLMAKANPMWGISLDPDRILEQAREAKRQPAKRGEFLRTRFNIWTGSGTSLIDPTQWAACRRRIQLEDFVGEKCWIGVDLASKLDMCSVALLFQLPNDVLAIFAQFYLPEQSETVGDPDLYGSVLAWREGGWLTLTEGYLADHDRVREDVEVFCESFDIQSIACDPYQSHNTAKRLWDGSKPVVIYPNNARTMTAPTDDLIARVVAQTLWHDGNPVLAWNAANVHGERKGNGSILPRKEAENSKRKIDGFVALAMANGCRMQPEESKEAAPKQEPADPYLTRGIVGFHELMAGRP